MCSPALAPNASGRAILGRLFLCLNLSWVGAPALGNTYYVRAGGDDYSDGDEAEDAFRTVERAVQVASAGDVIYVGAGTYTEGLDVLNKTGGSLPLRIVADTDGTRTGDAGKVLFSAGARFLIENSQNVQIEGFYFQGSTAESVIWRASSGSIIHCHFLDGTLPISVESGTLTLEGCEIARAGTDGIRVFSNAAVTIRNCTISESTESGVEANQDSQLTIEDTLFPNNALKGVRINALTSDAIGSGHTTIRRCTFTGNSQGVKADVPQAVFVEDSTFNANGWALDLAGSATLVNCQMNDNTGGGLWVRSMGNTDLNLTNISVTGTTGYGFYAENCTLTFNAAKLANLSISGSPILFGVYNSDVSFQGVTINAATSIAVYASLGQLTIRDSTISSGAYGVAATNTPTLIENSIISHNSIGLYANGCNSVVVRNSTLAVNTTWGAWIVGGNAGDQATFDRCVVRDGGGGISVSNAGAGNLKLIDDGGSPTLVGNAAVADLMLVGGTQLRDNASSGLHLENCNLTLTNQNGLAWRTLRNGYGLSCSQSTLTLNDLLVEQSTTYGLHCTTSTVHAINCQVSAPGGLISDQNASVTLDATRFNSTGSGECDWGVHCTTGDLKMRNCVVDGFTNGVYYTTTLLEDSARILNCTVAKAGYYGVYLTGSDLLLQNSIIAGVDAQYGLVQGGDQLLHSHNLFYGFQATYTGTTSDATELVKAPRFVDEANGDLHLAAGSPAINSGGDLSLLVTTDADGHSRPSFRAFEMGAYEYNQTNGSLRVLSWTEQRKTPSELRVLTSYETQ